MPKTPILRSWLHTGNVRPVRHQQPAHAPHYRPVTARRRGRMPAAHFPREGYATCSINWPTKTQIQGYESDFEQVLNAVPGTSFSRCLLSSGSKCAL
jgi:hypothetical protein